MMPLTSRKDTLCEACADPGEEPALCWGRQRHHQAGSQEETPGAAQPGVWAGAEGTPTDRTEPLSYF